MSNIFGECCKLYVLFYSSRGNAEGIDLGYDFKGSKEVSWQSFISRLVYKCWHLSLIFAVTNALAYYATDLITVVKVT